MNDLSKEEMKQMLVQTEEVLGNVINIMDNMNVESHQGKYKDVFFKIFDLHVQIQGPLYS